MLSVKSQLVLFSILLFIIVGSNQVYALTNKYLGTPLRIPFVNQTGAATPAGIFAHGLVFGLVLWAYLQTFNV